MSDVLASTRAAAFNTSFPAGQHFAVVHTDGLVTFSRLTGPAYLSSGEVVAKVGAAQVPMPIDRLFPVVPITRVPWRLFVAWLRRWWRRLSKGAA